MFYMTENIFKAPVNYQFWKTYTNSIFFTLYHGSKYKEHSRIAYMGRKNVFQTNLKVCSSLLVFPTYSISLKL